MDQATDDNLEAHSRNWIDDPGNTTRVHTMTTLERKPTTPQLLSPLADRPEYTGQARPTRWRQVRCLRAHVLFVTIK